MKPFRYTKDMEEQYTSQGYWGKPTLSEYWDRNAQDYPNKDAVVDSKTRISWGQAKKWYDRVALGLLELGFQKDDVIVSQLPNIVEAVLVRIALEKAGFLSLPVMMDLRQGEIEYILCHVDARGMVILPQFGDRDYLQMIQEIRPNLPKLEHVFVVGDQVFPGTVSLNEMSKRPIEEKYAPDHLEKFRIGRYEVPYLAMTSGTTGIPKFSEMPNIAYPYINTHIERWKLTQEDILLLLVPISGGVAFPWLFSGGPGLGAKMVMLERFDAEKALELIEKEEVTFAFGVPAQLTMILKHPALNQHNLSSLRAFFSAGALLPPDIAMEAEEKMKCRIIINFGSSDFGPISCTSYDDPPHVRFTSVGKPYPGNEVKIINEEGREVPRGEVGELCCRGPYASSGVYKDPNATIEVWGGELNGWFTTGDLAKMDEEENIYLVGRKKDIIKRGGKTIIPAEIENILITHPKVVSVAIVPMLDPVLGERACAYIIPKAGEKFTIEEMTSFLKKKGIASYKLPERVEIRDKFPTSGGGQKIMKKELEEDIKEKLKAEGNA